MLSLRILIPFLLCSIIWGTTWFVIRDQLAVVPPAWSIVYRFLIAAPAMFLVAHLQGHQLKMDRAGYQFALCFGLMQFVLNFSFVYRAEAWIPSGLVAVIFALLIVPNALLGRLFLGQRLSPRFLWGSAVALIGVMLLILNQIGSVVGGGHAALIGTGLTLMGVFAVSVANVMQGLPAGRRWPVAVMLAWAMLGAVAINSVFAWIETGPPVWDPRPAYLFGTLYLALAGSVLTFLLYYGLLRTVGPARASYTSVLTPILAMAISTGFEAYHWTVLALAGAVLALTGLMVALSGRRA